MDSTSADGLHGNARAQCVAAEAVRALGRVLRARGGRPQGPPVRGSRRIGEP